MSDLVSIIIPTYNREKYIEKTLKSSIEQTYKNIEIIVVNDGSTDNTIDVVYDYIGKYPNRNIYYIYKPNSGIASALNRGISIMKGKWFKWLSSDDILEPTSIETLVNYCNTNNYIFVYTDYTIIDSNDNYIKDFIEPTYTDYTKFISDLWDHHIGNASSSLIHKSIFDQIGWFNESLKHGEDYEFWLRASIIYGINIHRLPEKLLRYRTHNKQLTNKVISTTQHNNNIIRKMIKEKFIDIHGIKSWDIIMNEIKQHQYHIPLQKRIIRKLIPYNIRHKMIYR